MRASVGRHNGDMGTGHADFKLTMNELRVVARYAVEIAEVVLPLFEEIAADDPRPRAAIDAAWVFVHGAARTKLQRDTSAAAHRAAMEVSDEAAQHAARATADAAAAAYLHPLAQATQVGHILRATAGAAYAAEVRAGGNPAVGDALIEQAHQRATSVLIDLLHRYPRALPGKGRVADLTNTLDTSLRTLC